MTDSTRSQNLCRHAHDLGAEVDAAGASRLLVYLDAMLEKNQHLNLSGVRDPAAAEVLHALDSTAFALLGIPFERALDIGSGNGFPGAALGALYPDSAVTLMERTQKKARAIGEIAAAAELRNVDVACMDAAQAPRLRPELLGKFDLVTARAVGTPAQMTHLAMPFLAMGGHLVLWLAEDTDPEHRSRLTWATCVDYELPAPAARRRKLAVWRLD